MVNACVRGVIRQGFRGCRAEGCLGETGTIELARRAGAMGLAVLGLAGGLTVFSAFTVLVCLGGAVGLYTSLPRRKPPTGAVQPRWRPSIFTSDLIGFSVGVPLFTAAFAGAGLMPGSAGLWFLLLLLPAGLSIPVFMIAVRQETSWIRFFGNGFEVTELGRVIRVRYTDLARVELKLRNVRGTLDWAAAMLGAEKAVVLLGGSGASTALTFRRKDGSTFIISTEAIPDLERIFIDMDRAGIDLPAGLSERGKRRIRRVREKLYGKVAPKESFMPLPPEMPRTVREGLELLARQRSGQRSGQQALQQAGASGAQGQTRSRAGL